MKELVSEKNELLQKIAKLEVDFIRKSIKFDIL